MAILCSQCGETIEQDEAQFCPHCGAPVQRQSSTPQSSKHIDQSVSPADQSVPSPAQENKSAHEQGARQKTPLREQIAEQPGAKKQPSLSARIQTPEQAGKERSGEERLALKEQIAQIRPSSRPVSPAASTKPEVPDSNDQSTDHELQEVRSVKPHSVEMPADLPSTPPLTEQQDSREKEPVEERPTQLMESPAPTRQKDSQKPKSPVEEQPTQIITNKAFAHVSEDIPTAPLPLDKQGNVQSDGAPRAETASTIDQVQAPPAAPAERQEETGRPGVVVSDVAASALRIASSRVVKTRGSRKLLAAALVALLVLGVGAWIIVAQPFSVPAITQPQVGFNNDTLHVSLLYPNGWLYTISTSQSTVLFHDSSNTAQMSIATTNANGDDLSTYLHSQSDRVGIATPQTLSPESFAGATWQRIQGTVQQKGAKYTCTIYATVQGNRLITIVQQAPQTTYNEEDNLVFAQMRSSLKLS